MKTKVKRKHGRSLTRRTAIRARQRATLLIRRNWAGLLPLLVPPIVIATRSIKICVDGPLAPAAASTTTFTTGTDPITINDSDKSNKNNSEEEKMKMVTEIEMLSKESVDGPLAPAAASTTTLLIRRDRAGLLPLLVPPIVIATRSIKIFVDGPLEGITTIFWEPHRGAIPGTTVASS